MAMQSAPEARVKARKAKSEAAPMRAEMQEPVRAPARQKIQTGYFDREGNPITRKNPSYRNEFDFQRGEVPEEWEYQWIRHTVHGDPSESELWDMQENGWRPVPHERHASRFAPGELFKGDFEKGKKGCILRKGQLLVERPKGMCDEARAQQTREANAAVGDVFNRHAIPLPDNVKRMGMEPRRGTVRRHTDDVHDVRSDFLPKHELAID